MTNDPKQPNQSPPKRKLGRPFKGYERAWVRPFLESLRNNGNLRLACEAGPVTRATVYAHRDNCAAFKRKMEAAIADAMDIVEGRLYQAATSGLKQWDWKKDENGKLTKVEMPPEVSTYAMTSILRAYRPEKWVQRQGVELSGPEQGPVEVEQKGAIQSTVLILPAMGSDPEEVERQIAEVVKRLKADDDE